MSPDQSAVINAVALIQAERDELRTLLRHVITADCLMTPNGNHVAVIPAAVMAEIQLRINA